MHRNPQRWEHTGTLSKVVVSLPSIRRLETTPGPLSAQPRTIVGVGSALEAAGVEFTNDDQPGDYFSFGSAFAVFRYSARS
jgi:hypothetical protein